MMVRLVPDLSRKSIALVTSLLLVLFWVPGLLSAGPAHADSGSSIPNSPYNGGDGVIPDSNTSIQSISDPVGNVDTTSFTGGKEDDQCPGVTTQGLSSPKDDLTKVYFGSEKAAGDVFLYLAWVRSTTNGTTTIDFELNQATGALTPGCNGVNPERTSGDLLFTYDFSNGGGNVDVHFYTWDTSLNSGAGGWKAQGDITGLTGVVEAATDNTGIKGEMAVDLTLLPGVFSADTCKDFGTAWGKTRSSTSFGSEIKDFVTPQPAVISNCSPLEVLKEDMGTTPLAGATFSITPDAGTHTTTDTPTSCTTRLPDGLCYVPIAGSDPQAFELPLLFPGGYEVAETAAPPGYVLTADNAAPHPVTLPQPTNPDGSIVPLVFHDPTVPAVTAVKSSDPASGTVDNPTPVTPGQTINYTIAVSNSGDTTADSVVVTDAVPTGTTFASADNGGTASNGTVTWTVPVPGATADGPGEVDLHFAVTVDAADGNGTLIDNTAHFTNVNTPGCDANTCDTNTTHHEVEFSVLSMNKSSNPASGSVVQRGDRIDYTITVTNSGLAAGSASVVDTLPDNVTLVSGSASPAVSSSSGNQLTWNVPVPAKGTTSITYSVTVNSDAPEGATLTNVALVGGQCVGNVDQSACTTDHHVPTGALTLVKHVDKATANYGDTLTYTFDAATTGALNQTNVVVSDVLPSGTTLVGGSAKCTDAGPCTASYNSSNRTVSWQLGDMAAGAARHLVFKVTIDTPSFDPAKGLPPKTILNSGVIASTETSSTPSNVVKTTVVAVLGVKVVKKPTLAFTGIPAQELVTVALFLLGAGIILTSVRRRKES